MPYGTHTFPSPTTNWPAHGNLLRLAARCHRLGLTADVLTAKSAEMGFALCRKDFQGLLRIPVDMALRRIGIATQIVDQIEKGGGK
jgi:hypothetical protein